MSTEIETPITDAAEGKYSSFCAAILDRPIGQHEHYPPDGWETARDLERNWRMANTAAQQEAQKHHETRKKFQQSEAQAAVMREALQLCCDSPFGETTAVRQKWVRAIQAARGAVQSTAGEQLLREVERMREALRFCIDTPFGETRQVHEKWVHAIKTAKEALNQPTTEKP